MPERPQERSCNEYATFEVRFYESLSQNQRKFEIIYDHVANIEGYNDSVVVGVQKSTSVFDEWTCQNSVTKPQSNVKLTFARPLQSQCTPTPVPTQPPPPTPTYTYTPVPTPTYTYTPCPYPGCGTFVDVPPDNAFYTYVQCLHCRDIVSGYECGGLGEPCDCSRTPYFRPGYNVTRGQLSKMVAIAAGFTEPPGSQRFEDVPPGHAFYDWINRIAARGIIGGYQCGQALQEPCVLPDNRPYFRPGDDATRGQIAKMVSNAAGFSEMPITQTFEDTPPGSTFYVWVERLATRDIVGGYDCGQVQQEPCVWPDYRPYYRPYNTATRGQVSKIVANTWPGNCQLLKPGQGVNATPSVVGTGTPGGTPLPTVQPTQSGTPYIPSPVPSIPLPVPSMPAPIPTGQTTPVPTIPTTPQPSPSASMGTVTPVNTAMPSVLPSATAP